ncbi:MAG: hypothetical protein HY706_13220 [Candidatus Hydrogenedentes bacterium]|nr:hypothetical protein [Candidatus Hydrogenedentota bacterium]
MPNSKQTSVSFTRIAIFILFPAACFLGAGDTVQDKLINARAVGRATGTGTTARAAAIENAHLEMVLQTIEATLGSRDLRGLQTILDHCRSYIHTSRVLRENRTKDGVQVEVEAMVYHAALRHDLAALVLPGLLDPPKVLIMIAEQMPGESAPSLATRSQAEETLFEGFKKRKVSVAASGELRGTHSDEDLLNCIQREPTQAGKLALETRADVALVGVALATSEPEAAASNLQNNRAKVTINAVRADDEHLLDTLAAEAVVHSVDAEEGAKQAIQDATAKLLDELIATTVLAVAGREHSPDIFITIENSETSVSVQEVVRRTHECAGVRSVDELLSSPSQVRLRVKYSGGISPLVRWIVDYSYENFTLDEERVVGREITLRVIPK